MPCRWIKACGQGYVRCVAATRRAAVLMLGFARWKIILTLTVCLLGAALAAPNLLSRQQAEALPSWLPHRQISLGLDLQGGSHLLLQVDVQAVVRERMESLLESIRDELRKARIRYQDLRLDGRSVAVTIVDTAQIDEAGEALRKLDPDVQVEQDGWAIPIAPDGTSHSGA